MKMMRLLNRLLLVILFVAYACSSARESVIPSAVDLSGVYNPTSVRLHPAYTIYHSNPGISLLLVKIFPTELLYSGAIEPEQLMGQVKITYYLHDLSDIENPVQTDSGVYTYNIRREDSGRRFITQIPFRANEGKIYQLKVIARDQVRNEENESYLYVDKRSEFSGQNFMVIDVNGNIPVFQPYVLGNTMFKIRTTVTKYENLYISYFGGETPLAQPSFSLSREREFFNNPDSLWVLPLNSESDYQLNYEGIYHFRFDTTVSEGLTLFNFGPSYPQVQYVEELIGPLSYLATNAEYDRIKNTQNLKLALDNFWLDKAGSAERARELIRIYYNRVYYSNFYFTSAKPGWKSDRGMIFIIYGPPQTVTTSNNQEKWVYYKDNYSTKVTFTFDHVPTAYSLNNYILQPSLNFDTYWREAVNTWRKGNIYRID